VLGVESDGLYHGPVSSASGPAFRVTCASCLIDSSALRQDLGVVPGMPLSRCHESDPAVKVLMVVPLHER
jgi:hypothetical protein